MTLTQWLRSLGACEQARDWARQFHDDPNAAWHACERADWMHWLLAVTLGESPVTHCYKSYHYGTHSINTCPYCGTPDWTADDIREHVPDFPF